MSTDPEQQGPAPGWAPSSAAAGSGPLPPPAPPPGPGAGPANPTIGPGAPYGVAPPTPTGTGAPLPPPVGNNPPVAPNHPLAVPPPPPPDGMNKGLVAVLVAGALVILLGIGGYFFLVRGSQDPVKVEASSSNAPGTTAAKSSGTTPGTSDSSTRGTERGESESDQRDRDGEDSGTTLSIPTASIDVPPPTTSTTIKSGGNSGGGSSGGGGGNNGGGSSGGNNGGGGGGGGGGGVVTPTAPPTAPPTQPPTKPAVTSLTADRLDFFCTTTDTAKKVSITWTTTNANEVAVAVRNVPDAFAAPTVSGLGPSGTTSINVSCVDPSQQVAVLTARDASGNKASKTLTFTVRIIQT